MLIRNIAVSQFPQKSPALLCRCATNGWGCWKPWVGVVPAWPALRFSPPAPPTQDPTTSNSRAARSLVAARAAEDAAASRTAAATRAAVAAAAGWCQGPSSLPPRLVTMFGLFSSPNLGRLIWLAKNGSYISLSYLPLTYPDPDPLFFSTRARLHQSRD